MMNVRQASRQMDHAVMDMQAMQRVWYVLAAKGGNSMVRVLRAVSAEARAFRLAVPRMVDVAADRLAEAGYDFARVQRPTRDASEAMQELLTTYDTASQLDVRRSVATIAELADDFDDPKLKAYAAFLCRLADLVEYEKAMFDAWRAVMDAATPYVSECDKASFERFAVEGWPEDMPDAPPPPPLPAPPRNNGRPAWRPLG